MNKMSDLQVESVISMTKRALFGVGYSVFRLQKTLAVMYTRILCSARVWPTLYF